MISIPEGSFLMGSIPTTSVPFKRDEEEPQREIVLSKFQIGKFPVTNAQYLEFVKSTGHNLPKFLSDDRFADRDFPIVGVNWYDANLFVEWLNDRENSTYRLPTEAEWEKASRGEHGQKYPWGDEWSPENGNFAEGKLKSLATVGSYPIGASPYGCYDMAGNCYEWCSDWFHRDSYRHDSTENPKGAVKGRRKVIRGGSWNSRGEFSGRCANRAAAPPLEIQHWIGFRIARSA